MPNIPTFIRFTQLGALSLGLSVTLTYIFTEWLQIYYFFVYIFVLAGITTMNFILNTKYVFRVGQCTVHNLIKYLSVYGSFYAGNLLLVRIVDWLMPLHYTIIITIAAMMIFVFKFFVYGKFVFTK